MPAPSPKRRALKANATLNPHPEQIRDGLFLADDFFDPCDLLQVKYEMLRRVQKEGYSVTEVAAVFGFSRPAFYQAQSAFKQGGLAGLIPQKRGPKEAHKLSPPVMALIQRALEAEPRLPAHELARRVEQHFSLVVHPRSIERAVVRKKKKTQRAPMSLPPGVVERYESLRECVLRAGKGGDQGWALLMRCGLLAWARACQELASKERVAPLSPSVGVIPDHLSAPVVQVLAGMVLHIQHEVTHSV